MTILGIETSCDETAAAVVTDGVRILTNVVATSKDLYRKLGGIVPEIAAREQIKCIIPVIDAAVKSYKDQLEALAVTTGPGLIGSLLVGVETARALAYIWNKPLVPVNHLLGHIYANWLEKPSKKQPKFPAICLIVSGGHTELVLMKAHGRFKWLGGTRDDAAGEAFDKVARILGLGFPGGPAIQRTAEGGNPQAIAFPRPMLKSKDFDFSFSGLKTAVVNKFPPRADQPRAEKVKSEKLKVEDVAASFQEAAADVLVSKTVTAAQKYRVKSILLAGGVAANKCLREKIVKYAGNKFEVHIPPIEYCTDNAAYIASAAFFNYKPGSWQKIKAVPGLSLR